MKVEIKKEVYALLKGRDDLEDFVNSLVVAYLDGRFIRKSEVAGMVVAKPYKRSSFTCSEAFDATAHQFEGIVVEGRKESESLFIPSKKLHDLISDNQVLLVMKTPRDKGISVAEPECSFVRTERKEML